MILTNLCDTAQIRRLAPGMYDYPRQHSKLGDLLPTPEMVAQALADKDSSRIQPSGAYAANLLGLSEQVPAKVVFLTDATDRQLKVGRQEVILKRTTPRNMATAGRISGLVIQALRHLGQHHVDELVIDKLAQRLNPRASTIDQGHSLRSRLDRRGVPSPLPMRPSESWTTSPGYRDERRIYFEQAAASLAIRRDHRERFLGLLVPQTVVFNRRLL